MTIKSLYICLTWDKIAENFAWPKCFILSQKKNERDSKRTSLPNALSRTLGQTLANPLRVHPWIFIVIFFS